MVKKILKANEIERLENTSFAAGLAGAAGAEGVGLVEFEQSTPCWTSVTVTTVFATSDWLCDDDPVPPVANVTDGQTCGDDVNTCGDDVKSCAVECSCDCSEVCCNTNEAFIN